MSLPHATMRCQGGFPVRPWCLPYILVHRTLIRLLLLVDRLPTDCLNSYCQNHPLPIAAPSTAPELISQAPIFFYGQLRALESSAQQKTASATCRSSILTTDALAFSVSSAHGPPHSTWSRNPYRNGSSLVITKEVALMAAERVLLAASGR
jgi:hypothetical protein